MGPVEGLGYILIWARLRVWGILYLYGPGWGFGVYTYMGPVEGLGYILIWARLRVWGIYLYGPG